jgi:hypothetical protein
MQPSDVKTDVSEERFVFIIRVTINVIPISFILFTLMMEATRFNETSVTTRSKPRLIVIIVKTSILAMGKM